ncbi:MAG TPA: NAD-dependent epimerase/dehydratase family protein [Mucilaginibacter sp.]
MNKLIVTGSSGLIGSEVCKHFHALGWEVSGIDGNQRVVFFGEKGDTRWNQKQLESTLTNFTHIELDIRNREGVLAAVKQIAPDAIVHTAAQPSHDRAAEIPFDDFDTNAAGTFNMLEATRQYSTNIPFVHMSTNKVYGDGPNFIPMTELATRWEYADEKYLTGIPETFTIDQSKHSLFGASKLSADIYVQEYGRYFNMPTCVLRGGCLTGPSHSGVELHGFLSYLVKCNLEENNYTIYGYKGKQVRDNIHSYDVSRFIEEFIKAPRVAEVYNIGGGKQNTCSILEAFELVEKYSGKKMRYTYSGKNREGDHICYYSDLRKMKGHYPDWDISISLEETIKQIVEAWKTRMEVL